MRRTKLILRALTTCLALALPSVSAANTIVDTGTPILNFPWVFDSGQYFAGEFTIVDSFVIQTIEGYFDNFHGGLGTVDIAVHLDNGNVPGAVVFTASTPLAAEAPLGWYGVYGLGEDLSPGTYWVSFKPSAGINGAIKGGAPTPMVDYARGSGDYNWVHTDGVNIAVHINGDLVSVPDSTSTLSLFIGVAVLGFVAHRLWT